MYKSNIPVGFRENAVSCSMRKWYLGFLWVLLGWSPVAAQEPASAQFNLVLTDVQSIILNQSQKNVTIVLNDAEDFTNGKTLTQPDHLKISSTSEYEIKVAASSQLKGGSASIPVETIGISPSLGSRGGPNNTPLIFSDVSLSTNQQTLVHSEDGDVLRSFDIDYKVNGGIDYYNKPAGTYSTTITYSILPN